MSCVCVWSREDWKSVNMRLDRCVSILGVCVWSREDWKSVNMRLACVCGRERSVTVSTYKGKLESRPTVTRSN